MARRQTLALARELTQAADERSAPTLTAGRFEALAPNGDILVEVGGVIRPACVATSSSESELVDAIRARRDVLLGFLDDDPARPVVLGILRARIDLAPTSGEAAHATATERYLQIEASDGVRIRAGDASIELSADGRVEIRGVEIVSTAEGTNRVLGGNVGIN